MPEQEIIVPGRGTFRFPKSMSDQEIDSAFRRNFPAWFAKPTGGAGGGERMTLRQGMPLTEGPVRQPPVQYPSTMDEDEYDRLFKWSPETDPSPEVWKKLENQLEAVNRLKRKDGSYLLLDPDSGGFFPEAQVKAQAKLDISQARWIPDTLAKHPDEMERLRVQGLMNLRGADNKFRKQPVEGGSLGLSYSDLTNQQLEEHGLGHLRPPRRNDPNFRKGDHSVVPDDPVRFKTDEEFKLTLREWRWRKYEREAKAVRGAKMRGLMLELDDLRRMLEHEEKRIQKARDMDQGGEVYYDKWDEQGYMRLVETHNFKLGQLQKVLGGSVYSPDEVQIKTAGGTLGPSGVVHLPKWAEDFPSLPRTASDILMGRERSPIAGGGRKVGPLGHVSEGFGTAAKASEAALVDLKEFLLLERHPLNYFRNMKAFEENVARGEPTAPLPVDEDVAKLQFKDDFWKAAAANLGTAAPQMLPYLAGFGAARALGVAYGAPLAGELGGGAAMLGFNKDGSINRPGMMLAMLPMASRAGGKITEKVLTAQIEKTRPVLNLLMNPNTGKVAERFWASPSGKLLQKQRPGLTKEKFIQDWGNSVMMTGQLAGTGLYLAALRTPGWITADDPAQAIWTEIFQFLPWVMYSIRPRNMKGMPVEVLENLRAAMPRATHIERLPHPQFAELRARLVEKVSLGEMTLVEALRIENQNMGEVTLGEVRTNEAGEIVTAWRGLEKPGIEPPVRRIPGLPTEVRMRRSEPVPERGLTVPEAPREPGRPVTPREPAGPTVDLDARAVAERQRLPAPGGEPAPAPQPLRGLPAPSAALEITDRAAVQSIKNAIAEATGILLSGKKTTGEPYAPEALAAIRQSVIEQKQKIGDTSETPAVRGEALAPAPLAVPSVEIPNITGTGADIVKINVPGHEMEPALWWATKKSARAGLGQLGLTGELKAGNLELLKPKTADLGGGLGSDFARTVKKGYYALDKATGRPVRYVEPQPEVPAAPAPEVEVPVAPAPEVEVPTLAEWVRRLSDVYQGADVEEAELVLNEAAEALGEESSIDLEDQALDYLDFQNEGMSAEEAMAKVLGQPVEPVPTPAPAAPTVPEGIVTGKPAPLSNLQRGEKMEAQYAWVPASQLEASHKGEGFTKNEAFAPLKNTRDYSKNVAEQEKVLKMAKEFDPGVYLTFGKSAAVGPIMVSQGTDGPLRVLGGNARYQAIQQLKPEQLKELGQEANELAKIFGLPEQPSPDHLLVRLLPGHDASTKEGVAAANAVIDLLNPSEGLAESTSQMAYSDAVRLDPGLIKALADALGPGAKALRERKKIVEELLGHNKIDRNTRSRVLSSPGELEDYVLRLVMASVYGPEYGPLVADYAYLKKTERTYTNLMESPVRFLATAKAKGYSDIAEAFGAMMADVISGKENNPRSKLTALLDEIWMQGRLDNPPSVQAARSLAQAANKAIQATEGGRLKEGETHREWELLWGDLEILADNAAKVDDPQEALFEIDLGLLQKVSDWAGAKYGDQAQFMSEVVPYQPGAEPDPRVIRLNELNDRLQAHLARQAGKPTPDRKPVPQELSNEILELESALGQEFMGFFKGTKLKAEEDAKAHAEREALRERQKQENKPSSVPITSAQQDLFFSEPGNQMGLFEASSAQYLPWDDMGSLRGLKAADPFALREGTEVEAIFNSRGLDDWIGRKNLTEEELDGIGRVTKYERVGDDITLGMTFEGGAQVELKFKDGLPVEPDQLKLLIHQRGAIKNHERVMGPKEAKAEGIQVELELGDRRPLPPPPKRGMMRAREALMPTRKYGDWLRIETAGVWTRTPVRDKKVEEKFPMLRPHQRDAANRAIDEMQEGSGHFMNASGTGSGKTMTSLAVADHFANKYPDEYVLILTQNSSIIHGNFGKDAELMGLDIYEHGGKPPEADKRIYIGTYTDVQLGKIKYGEFSTIIMDEAHNMRNMLKVGGGLTAKRTDRLVRYAERVMYATATPMDQPEQLYAYRRLLDISHERAMLRVGIEFTEKGGYQPVEGVTDEMIEDGLEKVWSEIFEAGRAVKDEVPLDNVDLFLRRIKLSPRDVAQIARDFHNLEMRYWATAENPSEAGLARQKKNMGRKFLERAKISHVMDEARKHIKDGKKVIMFAYRVAGEKSQDIKEETLAAYYYQLQQEGIPVAKLFGPMSTGRKMAEVAKFQEGNAKIILATPGSGGTGINLDDVYGDAPRVLMMVTPPYSALEMMQMMGRAARLMTQGRVQVVLPITTHWVDNWNLDISLKKLRRMKVVVGGDIKLPKKFKQLETEVAEYVPEKSIPREVLVAQKNAGEQAAIVEAFLQSIESISARKNLRAILSGPGPLSGANLIAGIDADYNKFGVASLLGRHVKDVHEIAALTPLIRNALVEVLLTVGVSAQGQVVSFGYLGLGSPISTQGFNWDEITSAAQQQGAETLYLIHNEPIGVDVATYSPADMAAIETGNNYMHTVGIVHDFNEYAILEAGGKVSHGKLPEGLAMKYFAAEGAPQQKSLIGSKVGSLDPNTGEKVLDHESVFHALIDATGNFYFDNQLSVTMLGPKGHIRAIVEIDPAFAVTPEGIQWLRQTAAANGAVMAFGLFDTRPVSLGESEFADGFAKLLREGVFTDIMASGTGEPISNARLYQSKPSPDLPAQHIMGVPNTEWGQFESETVEYRPEDEHSSEAYTYDIKGPSGKIAKVPVKLGGMNHVKPIKMTWAIKLYESIMGKRPKVKRIPQRGAMKKQGYFSPAEGDVVIDVGMFRNEHEAAKTLMHEFGHWADWMDEKTLSRGNIIGRLKSLHGFLRRKLGDLDNKDLQEELKDLSAFWRPWDRAEASESFRQYRDSSKELYADALSVLFNDPLLLQERAPLFYRAFFEYIDAKPELSSALIQLWETLDHDYVANVQGRITDSLEEYAKGDEIIRQKGVEARDRKKHWKSWWNHLSFALNYRHSKFEEKLGDAKSRGYNPRVEVDPRVLVEESLWFSDNITHKFLEDVWKVVRELDEAGVDEGLLGKWMELERVVYERSMLANPGGESPLSAKEELAFMRSRKYGVGPKVAGLMQNYALPRLHSLFFPIMEMAVEVGIISPKTFKAVIEPNQHVYVPFAVLKYLSDRMPAGVKRQWGTFEAIANPLHAWVMKAAAMLNFIAAQKAKRVHRDFLKEQWGTWEEGGISLAPTKKYLIPKSERHPDAYPYREEPIKDPDAGILTVFEGGRPRYYYVDPLIAAGFEHDTPAALQAVTGWFTHIFRGYLYPIFITYNPSFHSYNLIRDFARTRRTLQIPRRTMLKQYVDALAAATARLKGESHPLIQEMMENMAIGPANVQHLEHMNAADTTAEGLAKFGLIEPEPETIIQKLQHYKVIGGIAYMGDLFESLPKIATYKYLREYNKKTPRDAAFVVRNYAGTPHTRRQGMYIGLASWKIPFFNVYKEGFKADYEMASGSYGHVRTEPFAEGPSSKGEGNARKTGWDRARSAAGWWWWYVKANGFAALFQGLASGGFLGDDLEEYFAGVGEYDKTNSLIIPLGYTTGKEYGKKVVYWRMPRDPAAQLISGLIYKMVRQFGDDPRPMHEALRFTLEAGPSDNPVITTPRKWIEFAQGKNPEDSFRDRPILTREGEAVTTKGMQEMILWSVNQAGLRDYVNVFRKDRDKPEGILGTLTTLPVFSRFLKVTDSGYRQRDWDRLTNKQMNARIHKSKHGDSVKRVLKEFYVLGRMNGMEGGLSPEREMRYTELKTWHRDTFTPMDSEVQSQEMLGSEKAAKDVRIQLEAATIYLLSDGE